MIAALYVMSDGPYSDLPEVDPWDVERDARTYPGPYPVVAHPPCARWGRYWGGGPSARVKRQKGDDAGCFASALTAVRNWGGVLEHPEASHAWPWFGLQKPKYQGGWWRADEYGGWTCCVAQGHYGHRGQKMTWLYTCGIAREDLPELTWGRCKGMTRLEPGYHSKEERARAVKTGACKRLYRRQRLETPEPFRDLLISIARLARKDTR